MKRVASILTPVDFSDSSNCAFETALDLAKSLNADLHLLHALEAMSPIMESCAISLPSMLVGEARDVMARKLEKSRQKALARGVDVDSQLCTAPAATAIVERAEELGVDLIIIGRGERKGFEHAPLGSVTQHTLRHAPCPVLTVGASRG
jgi:nucleotide-binding universal stress UspA family protein